MPVGKKYCLQNKSIHWLAVRFKLLVLMRDKRLPMANKKYQGDDNRTNTTGVILCEHIKALDLSTLGYKVIEKLPKDLLEEVIDTVAEPMLNRV